MKWLCPLSSVSCLFLSLVVSLWFLGQSRSWGNTELMLVIPLQDMALSALLSSIHLLQIWVLTLQWALALILSEQSHHSQGAWLLQRREWKYTLTSAQDSAQGLKGVSSKPANHAQLRPCLYISQGPQSSWAFSAPWALSTSAGLTEGPAISVASVPLVQAQPHCSHLLWVK